MADRALDSLLFALKDRISFMRSAIKKSRNIDSNVLFLPDFMEVTLRFYMPQYKQKEIARKHVDKVAKRMAKVTPKVSLDKVGLDVEPRVYKKACTNPDCEACK